MIYKKVYILKLYVLYSILGLQRKGFLGRNLSEVALPVYCRELICTGSFIWLYKKFQTRILELETPVCFLLPKNSITLMSGGYGFFYINGSRPKRYGSPSD